MNKNLLVEGKPIGAGLPMRICQYRVSLEEQACKNLSIKCKPSGVRICQKGLSLEE
jgi:hypothetical protein